jgi:hypothetical protein
MGSSQRQGKGAVSKGKGKGDAAESKFVKRVDLYKFSAKWMLRSYPDERGNPLMCQPSAQAALAPEALRKSLDQDCCELMRRPTMGVNLCAASIDGAALHGPALQETLEKLLPKITADDFLEKVQFFNLARGVDRNLTEGPSMCKRFFKHVRKLVREDGDNLAALAEAAAGIYLGTVAMLELGAVSGDMRAWAKAVPDRKKQSKYIQAWLSDPGDEEKLFAAVVKSVKEDLKNESRHRRFGEAAAVADDSSSSPVLGSSVANSVSDASSPSPKAGKKKHAKGKKNKKNKSQTKTRATKHRKEEMSSEASGAAAPSPASSQASEPVAKKRKHSAAAAGSKGKKKARKAAASVESDSASSQHPPAKMAAKTADLCSAWPLSELQAFEQKAAQQVTAADGAALDVEQRLALTRGLPTEIRQMIWQRAGLLLTTEEDEVLKANAERLLQHTVEMVKEVRLAWVQAAVQEDKKKSNVTLLPEDRLFRELRTEKLSEEARADWEAALKGDSSASLRKRAELLRGLWQEDEVVSNYNKALTFAEKYAVKEPKKEQALGLVTLIPLEMAAAFGLPGPEKFERQKPANWKNYCSVSFTLAWHIFKAYVDLSADNP